MIVKYKGRFAKCVDGQMLVPGVNEIKSVKFFQDHLKTELGIKEVARGDWEIISDKKSTDKKQPTFFELPISKQKEILSETFDEKYLNELLENKQISKIVKDAIKDRLKDLAITEDEIKNSKEVK